MHLGALATFRPVHHGDPGRVAVLLAERAQRLSQLRRRVQPSWFPLAAANWKDDLGFCAKDHIHLHHLDDCHGSLDGAASLAAELMIRPLSRSRPLWEFHIITGAGWDRLAVLFKMHHAFGDGLNALEIGVRVLDGVALPGGGALTSDEVADGGSGASEPAVLSQLWRVPGGLREAVGGVVGQLSDATSIAASVLRSAHLPAPASPLVIQSSGRRALAVAALDLQQVRRIRASYGGTVNDVLLAVVTGALRRWVVARGGQVDGLILRAFIPVSQRARSAERTGGNRLSGYLCDLPVGEPDPREQLLMIRRGMEQNRATGGSRGPGAIPVLADRLPPAVLRVAAPVAGQGASLLFDLMVTSIPVPSIPFTLDDAALAEVFPIAPLAAGQALVVGLSWYQGRAYVALNVDRDGLPDVQQLAEAVQPATTTLDSLASERLGPLAALRVNAGDSSYRGGLGSPSANFRRCSGGLPGIGLC
jgi:diacylglycerol O-acyltransferase